MNDQMYKHIPPSSFRLLGRHDDLQSVLLALYTDPKEAKSIADLVRSDPRNAPHLTLADFVALGPRAVDAALETVWQWSRQPHRDPKNTIAQVFGFDSIAAVYAVSVLVRVVGVDQRGDDLMRAVSAWAYNTRRGSWNNLSQAQFVRLTDGVTRAAGKSPDPPRSSLFAAADVADAAFAVANSDPDAALESLHSAIEWSARAAVRSGLDSRKGAMSHFNALIADGFDSLPR